jgi:hypothetical protein
MREVIIMNVSAIVKKIKYAYNVDTNAQLAVYFDISSSAIDSWGRQKKVPEKYITRCILDTGVSENWLLSEDKPTFPNNKKEVLIPELTLKELNLLFGLLQNRDEDFIKQITYKLDDFIIELKKEARN